VQYTVLDFIAFCESKGNEEFDYGDNWDCAIAQFMKHIGYVEPSVGVGFAYINRHIEDEQRIAWNPKIDEKVRGLPGHDIRSFSETVDRLKTLDDLYLHEVMFEL
jgi:hypothetical protein